MLATRVLSTWRGILYACIVFYVFILPPKQANIISKIILSVIVSCQDYKPFKYYKKLHSIFAKYNICQTKRIGYRMLMHVNIVITGLYYYGSDIALWLNQFILTNTKPHLQFQAAWYVINCWSVHVVINMQLKRVNDARHLLIATGAQSGHPCWVDCSGWLGGKYFVVPT